MKYETAIILLENGRKASRSRQYKIWREMNSLTKEQLESLENAYPADREDPPDPMREAMLRQANGENPIFTKCGSCGA